MTFLKGPYHVFGFPNFSVFLKILPLECNNSGLEAAMTRMNKTEKTFQSKAAAFKTY